MRKYAFTLVLTFFYFISPAQTSIGLNGGYVFADLGFGSHEGMPAAHSSGLTAWQASVYLNIPLSPFGWYLQPQAGFVRKGASFLGGPKEVSPSGATGVGSNLRLDYVEAPVNVVYKFRLPFGKLALGVGPYAAYGLNGHYAYSMTDGSGAGDQEKKVQFCNRYGSNSSAVNVARWDAGANGMFSLEFNNYLTLGANYSYGLVDINRANFGDVKNRYLGITLGVLLNREDY